MQHSYIKADVFTSLWGLDFIEGLIKRGEQTVAENFYQYLTVMQHLLLYFAMNVVYFGAFTINKAINK